MNANVISLLFFQATNSGAGNLQSVSMTYVNEGCSGIFFSFFLDFFSHFISLFFQEECTKGLRKD